MLDETNHNVRNIFVNSLSLVYLPVECSSSEATGHLTVRISHGDLHLCGGLDVPDFVVLKTDGQCA